VPQQEALEGIAVERLLFYGCRHRCACWLSEFAHPPTARYRCTHPPQTGKTSPTKQLADSLHS